MTSAVCVNIPILSVINWIWNEDVYSANSKMSQPFVLYRPGQNAASSSSVGDAQNAATSVQPPSTHYEHFLTEIESYEGNLAGVLR